MAIQDSNFTVTAEQIDFRTLGVIYEDSGHKLTVMCEQAADLKNSWIVSSEDLSYWQSGQPLSDLERQEVIARLNAWGRVRGWTFSIGVKLIDVKLEDVAPDKREFIRNLQEIARKS